MVLWRSVKSWESSSSPPQLMKSVRREQKSCSSWMRKNTVFMHCIWLRASGCMLPLPNYTSFTTSSVIIHEHVCCISFVAASPDYFCLACAYQIGKKHQVLLLVCDYTMLLTSGCIDPSSSIVLGVYIYKGIPIFAVSCVWGIFAFGFVLGGYCCSYLC